MIQVKVDIIGSKETIAKLRKLQGGFDDWSPELTKVKDYLLDFYKRDVYETEGGIFGMRWPSLQVNYDFMKRKKYPGRGTLEATGAMRKSYKGNVQKTFMEIENTDYKAIFHQRGTSRMPQRVLLTVDGQLKNKIITIFKEGISKKLKDALT